jgi:hypothetical protein
MTARVTIEMVSSGTTLEGGFNLVLPTAEVRGRPAIRKGIVTTTEAKLLLVEQYLAHLNLGTNTTTVDDAITNLGS